MEYTNSGLVKYCKDALKLNTKYMWGGLFREITAPYINQLAGMYPNQYPKDRISALNSFVGKDYYGCDCVGLVKSYYFGGVGVANNARGYVGSKDYGVGSMYNAAKTKGEIDTMPQTEGILVMTANFGHVGVYIGGGQVIECTLGKRGDGVVQTALSAGGWAYWCQCPCITDDTGGHTAKTLPAIGETNNTVNVRAAAGLDGKKLAQLKQGVKVRLTGKTESADDRTWVQIEYEGQLAWCDKQWINC